VQRYKDERMGEEEGGGAFIFGLEVSLKKIVQDQLLGSSPPPNTRI
jgi:hypothetical protein